MKAIISSSWVNDISTGEKCQSGRRTRREVLGAQGRANHTASAYFAAARSRSAAALPRYRELVQRRTGEALG